jgi:hypothetical protein
MADTNLTGPQAANKQGSVNGRYTYLISPTATATTFARITASTSRPVIVEAQVYVVTLDATETVAIGSNDADYDNLINDAALDTADVFLPASNATGKLYLTADTDIKSLASAGTDTAVIVVILDLATVNTATTTGL